MPPKKKGNKKAADDWEAELGETIAPANGAAAPADAQPGDEDGGEEGDAPVGGLMAMMKKNREKRKKKGLSEDFHDGDAAADDDADDATPAPAPKAAEEATMDDEFALPEKKGKGGKGGKQQPAAKADGDEGADSGRVLTKAEKEKQKKEREKQRKKEQVRRTHHQWLTGLFPCSWMIC